MDSRLVDRQVSCPFCGEPMTVTLDLSAGGQSYIEDCQICCQPMQLEFDTDGNDISWLRVDRAQ